MTTRLSFSDLLSIMPFTSIHVVANGKISFFFIYPKKTKMLIQEDACTPVFIAALFTVANGSNLSVHQQTNA